MVVGSADNGAVDADEAHEGACPARRVHSPAPSPLPTAAGDCACNASPVHRPPLPPHQRVNHPTVLTIITTPSAKHRITHTAVTASPRTLELLHLVRHPPLPPR
jgi:hypothetical protein